MNILKHITNKRYIAYAASVLGAAAIIVSGLSTTGTQAAGTNTMYVSPASATYTIGTTYTVSIRENSNTDPVNAVQADLSYTSSKLQFVSIDASSSAFGIDASSSGGSGNVSISRGSTTAVTGDKLIAKVKFKAIASGTATISFKGSSVVLSSTTNTNVVDTMTGSTITVKSPTTTTPPPTTTKPPTTTTPTPTTTTPTTSSGVSIAPQGNSTPVAVPDGSEVKVQAPATVETKPEDGSKKDVTKVEYYLNGKLVATATTAPYTHNIDTAKLRNGKYKLESKTHYKDGEVETKNTGLIVDNPFGWTQFTLWLRHYAWVFIILAIIIVDIVWTMINRRKGSKWLNHPGGSSGIGQVTTGGGSDSSTNAAVLNPPAGVLGGQSTAHVVSPEATADDKPTSLQPRW